MKKYELHHNITDHRPKFKIHKVLQRLLSTIFSVQICWCLVLLNLSKTGLQFRFELVRFWTYSKWHIICQMRNKVICRYWIINNWLEVIRQHEKLYDEICQPTSKKIITQKICTRPALSIQSWKKYWEIKELQKKTLSVFDDNNMRFESG